MKARQLIQFDDYTRRGNAERLDSVRQKRARESSAKRHSRPHAQKATLLRSAGGDRVATEDGGTKD